MAVIILREFSILLSIIITNYNRSRIPVARISLGRIQQAVRVFTIHGVTIALAHIMGLIVSGMYYATLN